MKNNHRQSLKEELLSNIEPSPELQEHFTREIDGITRRRLSRAEVIRNAILTAIFIGMAIIFICVAYFAATVPDKGLPQGARIFMYVGFAAGSCVFLAGAIYAIAELRSGHVAPRRNQQVTVAMSAGFVLVLTTAYMVFWRRFSIPLDRSILAGIYLLFYWIMAVAFVIKYTIQWHHEDLLIEQKRTQLEIALLREEISGKEKQQKQ
jgi:hypothetical protein